MAPATVEGEPMSRLARAETSTDTAKNRAAPRPPRTGIMLAVCLSGAVAGRVARCGPRRGLLLLSPSASGSLPTPSI